MRDLVWRPVLPWPLLVVVAVVLVGFVAWRIVSERGDRRMLTAWVRRAAIVVLLLIVAARPGIPGGTAKASVAELNVFFVVDTTSSSAAEDWDGTEPRLDGMRADIESITADLAGARFSLISFDQTAIQRVPLTEDASAVVTSAQSMRQEITYYSKGSTISEAASLLGDRLKAAHTADPRRANVVYYLGDGEQTADTAPGSFSADRASTDGGGVLGYGTAAGGRMKVFDGYGDQYSAKGYIEDKTKSGSPDAVSVIDQGNLNTIASQLGVPYLHREAGRSLASVVDDAKKGHVTSAAGSTDSTRDLYWIPAIALFLLLFIEIAVVARALGDVRPRRIAAGGGRP
ncbi:Ca-activated chloride channel family protein [Frondihabitans sp. PhB188]|uniref:vWA domain-containing protein n=1 Tax=Frondihabitans sp. PhB188 TaxID=2485200 RepID=UPI000F4626D8|nr:VWA domain-containing protein [Frondihabitans sp. PhB188]ROQ41261.1 Ca-activated chloride channel family protein [Frondihabitans sp. PhB188]